MRKTLMQTLLLAALAAPALTIPALADDGVTVALPDQGQIARAASESFLHALVLANVVGMNCDGHRIDDGEWALIVGTADLVAAALKLDSDAYDRRFYGPAFAALDQPGTCATEGPKIEALIARLKAMGGDTVPLG
jgi:hypothetical protein